MIDEQGAYAVHQSSTVFTGQRRHVAEAPELSYPGLDGHGAGPADVLGVHLGQDAGRNDIFTPVSVPVGTISNGTALLDGVPVQVVPLLTVSSRVVPPGCPPAAIAQHPSHLGAPRGRVQPVPRLGEGHQVGTSGCEWKEGSISYDGPRARPSLDGACEHSWPVVDHDDHGAAVL